MIKDYYDEISDILAANNIYVNRDDSGACLLLGMIFNELRLNQENEKSLKIQIANGTDKYEVITDNILFISRQLFPTLSENRVMSKFLTEQSKQCIIVQAGNHPIKQYDSGEKIETYLVNICCENSCSSDNLIPAIGSLFPKLFPDFFTNKDTEELLPYLNELLKTKDVEKFLSTSSFIDCEKIEKEHIMNGLRYCAKYAQDQRMTKAREKVESIRTRANSLLDSYNNTIREINEQLAILNAGDKNSEESMDDFFEYLISNKNIEIEHCSNGVIEYIVTGYISIFDIDMYDVHTNNFRNSMYRSFDEKDIPFVKKILDKIFLEKKYKIRIVSSFMLVIDGRSYFDTYSSSTLSHRLSKKYPDRMLSPHHGLYVCPGSYAPMWIEALENGDYITAVQTTLSLAQNINWSDNIVCEAVLRELKNGKYIEDKNGKLFTLNELIKNEEMSQTEEK